MRIAEVKRKTNETDICLSVNLDGKGQSSISSGVGFLDHMLTLFSKHSRIDIDLTCKGDTYTDDHHSVEDIGICLGMAIKKALGDMKGITRYADIVLPMDEALVLCAVDISGRSYLGFDVSFLSQQIGSFQTELIKEFFAAFALNAGITLHLRELCGENSHHVAEACYKACARAVRSAIALDADALDEIPSTKGVL